MKSCKVFSNVFVSHAAGYVGADCSISDGAPAVTGDAWTASTLSGKFLCIHSELEVTVTVGTLS